MVSSLSPLLEQGSEGGDGGSDGGSATSLGDEGTDAAWTDVSLHDGPCEDDHKPMHSAGQSINAAKTSGLTILNILGVCALTSVNVQTTSLNARVMAGSCTAVSTG